MYAKISIYIYIIHLESYRFVDIQVEIQPNKILNNHTEDVIAVRYRIHFATELKAWYTQWFEET